MNLDLFNNLTTEPTFKDNSFTFIDLFAGIGGFHLALESLGGKCVFASEKDSFARQTYCHNFDTSQFEFNDDIRKVAPSQIPDHDILCAGFPCQPFSQAGLKKGFQDGHDSERGNLFFCILDILEAKQPKAFILENVRHLEKNHLADLPTSTLNSQIDIMKSVGHNNKQTTKRYSPIKIPTRK